MREIVREATWIEDKPARARTGLATILSRQRNAVTFAVMAVANLLVTPYLGMFGWMGFTFFVTPAFLVLALYAWSQELPAERERRYDVLREEFMGVQGTLVQMIVRQGDAPTGEDEGVLWFEEGRLYFAGRRTSFGLVPGQARSLAPPHGRLAGFRNGVDVILRRDTNAGAVSLSFKPLLPSHESVPVHRDALRRDLDQWLGGWTEGSGQFPPSELGPATIDEQRLLAQALLATIPVPLLLYLLTSSYAWGPFLAINSLILIVAGFPASNLRWRALRDRRRLRRGR